MAVNPSFAIYRSLPRHNTQAPSAVTIGNFDGVHLGHQSMLAQVTQAAAERNVLPTVMTFEPHPRAYFAALSKRPELIPGQINSLRDKLQTLAHHQIRQLILLRFNQALSSLSPEEFIHALLVKGLNTRWLLVGEDFRYGHKRAGDVALLRQAGKRYGFEVETIADVVDNQGQRISSSELRTALAMGEQNRIQGLLGHPYRLSGHVIHGRKLGRSIGVPTLNIRAPQHCAARSGVYVVQVHGLSEQPLKGVASLGVRPTVEDHGKLLLEVHVLDADLDAYGKLACVDFLSFIRDETTFPNLSSMMTAIHEDVQHAHKYFASHGL